MANKVLSYAKTNKKQSTPRDYNAIQKMCYHVEWIAALLKWDPTTRVYCQYGSQ